MAWQHNFKHDDIPVVESVIEPSLRKVAISHMQENVTASESSKLFVSTCAVQLYSLGSVCNR